MSYNFDLAIITEREAAPSLASPQRIYLVDEVAPEVFAFDLWTVEQCEKFLFLAARRSNALVGAPNSMNKYGRVVGGELHDVVVWASWLAGLVARSQYGVESLKREPYAFIVDYDMQRQRSLAKHFDSSDVTLNVCLSKGFTGGELVFYKGKRRYAVKHRIGRALVHRGSLVHRAMPLKGGVRSNLILWCESKKKGKRK